MYDAHVVYDRNRDLKSLCITTGRDEVVVAELPCGGLPYGDYIIIPMRDLPPIPVVREKADGTIFYDYLGHPERPEPADDTPEVFEHYALGDIATARALRAYQEEKERKAGYAATLETVRKATLPEEMPPISDLVAALRDLGFNIVEG